MSAHQNPHPSGWGGCQAEIGCHTDGRTHYVLDVERVAEFAAFVRYSGGFKIH